MNQQPPNIVYINSHDTGRYIEPYGHKVNTPNLQRLAEEGVMFRNAFAAAPTCCPSRAALLSGQWTHNTGMLGLVGLAWQMNDYARHLAPTLSGAGYATALIGLQHVARDAAEIGYDQVIKPDRHFFAEEISEAAESFLADVPRDRPFYLEVGYFLTHRPFYGNRMSPEQFAAEYDEEAKYAAPPEPLPDIPDIRRDMAAFNRQAESLDHHFGRVFAALERAGLDDNTLVIATTDHGIAFPRLKCNVTDHGTGVFLIMRGPGGSDFRGGKLIEPLVSQVDVFPTICDLIGIDPPDWLQGRSMTPLVTGEASSIRDELFSEVTFHAAYEPQRSVRTERYRYVRRYDNRDRPVLPNVDGSYSKQAMVAAGWPDQPRQQEMLFDLYLDPHETNNRAADPAMAEVLVDMRGRLERWMRETDDPLLASGVVELPEGCRTTDVDDYAPWIEAKKPDNRLAHPPE